LSPPKFGDEKENGGAKFAGLGFEDLERERDNSDNVVTQKNKK
jgi:hypothetical protein